MEGTNCEVFNRCVVVILVLLICYRVLYMKIICMFWVLGLEFGCLKVG
jgi:hypothetical protein